MHFWRKKTSCNQIHTDISCTWFKIESILNRSGDKVMLLCLYVKIDFKEIITKKFINIISRFEDLISFWVFCMYTFCLDWIGLVWFWNFLTRKSYVTVEWWRWDAWYYKATYTYIHTERRREDLWAESTKPYHLCMVWCYQVINSPHRYF